MTCSSSIDRVRTWPSLCCIISNAARACSTVSDSMGGEPDAFIESRNIRVAGSNCNVIFFILLALLFGLPLPRSLNQSIEPQQWILNREYFDIAEAASSAYLRNVDTRITVPVAADGCSAIPAGRQCRILKPYIRLSTTPASGSNSSATRSSTTSAAPSFAQQSPHGSERRHRVRHIVNTLHGEHQVVTASQLGVASVANTEVRPVRHSKLDRMLGCAVDGRLVRVESVDLHVRIGLRHSDARPPYATPDVRHASVFTRLQPLGNIGHRWNPYRAE